MKSAKKIISVLLAAVMSLMVFTACAESTDVYEIDGEKVSWDLYRYYYLNLKYQYDSGNESFWSNNNYAKEQLKEDVLYYIKRDFAIDNIAKDLNIALDDNDIKKVDDSIAEIKAMLGGDEEYEQFLAASYTSSEMYYELVKRDALGQKIWDVLYGENGTKTLTDDEMLKIIDEEYVCAYHVLITFETENAKELAVSVAQKAQNGEDFSKLIEKYGEDPGMKDNDDGYYFTKGEMVPEFETAAFALKEGEISEPVMSSYGYHIIKRVAMDDQYIKDNLDEIRESYYNITTSLMIQDYIDDLEAKEQSAYKKVNIDME